MVLITGGAGFIGSNLVHYWMQATNDIIINVDNLTYAGNVQNLAEIVGNQRHVFVRADIGDTETISTILKRYRPSAVINLAAESHVDRSIIDPDAFIDTNVVGTHRLLKAVHSYWRTLIGADRDSFRFLHVSTDEVYGSLDPDAPPFREATAYAPNSPYAASKAALDHLVRAWHHTSGLPVLTTNCSNNYGPFQFPEKLIPLVIRCAFAGEPLPVYGDGRQVRDLALCRRPLRGNPLCAGTRPPRRDLQHRRRKRAHQPRRAAPALRRTGRRQAAPRRPLLSRPDHLREGPARA